MADDSIAAQNAMGPASMLAPVVPGVIIWAGVYAALFYACSGMIACMYRPQ